MSLMQPAADVGAYHMESNRLFAWVPTKIEMHASFGWFTVKFAQMHDVQEAYDTSLGKIAGNTLDYKPLRTLSTTIFSTPNSPCRSLISFSSSWLLFSRAWYHPAPFSMSAIFNYFTPKKTPLGIVEYYTYKEYTVFLTWQVILCLARFFSVTSWL